MTREEEIKCASKDYVNYLLDKQEYHNEIYTEYDIQQAFEKGAQWADDNPKSPWISVNDDLPNNPKYLKQPDFSSWVIAVTENTEVIPAQMIIMNGKWIWHSHFNWKHEDITHWMFIPKLPKEEEAKELLPVVQTYVDDEKREAINKELEEEAKKQPCVTIENFIEQMEARKKEIGDSAAK